MSSTVTRLAWAAGLSLTCAGATLAWYRATEIQWAANGEAPLAQVSRVGDEVLRRPPSRLLWQPVNTGDNLYNGETLRTSPQGEMRIQFEDGRYIDLDPDSLIVLQKNKGEISLDLMEGSLFVNGQSGNAEGASGLVLNSKNGKVDLSRASASLSKGSGDGVDVQVVNGQAKIQDANGKTRDVESGSSSSTSLGQGISASWKVLAPLAGKQLYVNPSAMDPIHFRWQGLPASVKVTLWTGPTRKNLQPLPNAITTENDLNATLALGKIWWKLVASDSVTQKALAETPVTRLEILGRYAPAAIFPSADADLPLHGKAEDFTFRWQKTEMGRVQIEVAKDPQMRKLVLNRAFSTEDQVTIPKLVAGSYYWRLTAREGGLDKPVVGPVTPFRLHEGEQLPAEISWAVPNGETQQNYIGHPQIDLKWLPKTRAGEIAGYRLRLEDSDKSGSMPITLESRGNNLEAKVNRPGRYLASVEALDRQGSVIGKSPSQTFDIKERPLIDSPTLLPAQGDLKTSANGQTELKWNSVEGAKEYSMILTDEKGKEIGRKKYGTAAARLKGLMPGKYTVKLEAIDKWDRESRDPQTRVLIVPDKSDLRAPTLKKIKVQ